MITGTITSTLDPTFRQLDKQGNCFFFVRRDFDSIHGYGTLSLPEITYKDHYAVDLDGMLEVLGKIANGRIILVAESFFVVRWDAARSLIGYAYAISLMRLARQPVIVLLYDAVKPLIAQLQWTNDSSRLYQGMITEADGLIFNSNDRDMSDFVINSAGVDIPHINFYRYTTAPAQRLERLARLDGGIHLVAISMYLGDFDEPSRNDIADQVVSVLKQGIHLHYHSDHAGSSTFMDFLPATARSFLHVHPIQRDQERLVQELTQYSAGWMPTDCRVIFRSASLMDDPYYPEIFMIFPPTTIASSLLAYNCAGLPVITNRTLHAIRRVTGEETIIAMESSEIPNIGKRLKSLDWQSLWGKSWDKRKQYDIATNIDRLIEFLAGFGGPELHKDPPSARPRTPRGRKKPFSQISNIPKFSGQVT